MRLSLPFVTAQGVPLTWREIQVGVQNGWLTPSDAVDLAIAQASADPNAPQAVVELASVLDSEDYRIPEVLRQLAESDPAMSPNKWLFLLLTWLYEHRDEYEDPFQMVEQLYGDFDYPEEIAALIPYMPPKDPSKTGKGHLLEEWRSYLDQARGVYVP